MGVKHRDREKAMDGWSAKVSCQTICLLELMTQRLRDRKPLYCPWWLSTEQAPSVNWQLRHSGSADSPRRHSDTNQPPDSKNSKFWRYYTIQSSQFSQSGKIYFFWGSSAKKHCLRVSSLHI